VNTSRSAIITFQSCPRKRFWQYHYNDQGLEPVRQSIPLVWGSALHKGMESLLSGVDVDGAVQDALDSYAEQCAERAFDIDDLESQSFVYAEGKALIEGFIRAWALERLPDFMATYEVLEVEHEGLWKNWADNIDLAYRPDALLRKRNTGGLYVFNLKSSYAWTDKELKSSRYNVQGLSELAALEQRLGERLAGIQDEIFIKGSRQKQKDDTHIQNTFLVHPWLKSGITSDDDEWAWKYYFDAAGRSSRLGAGYSRVNVWEHLTMRDWVQMLADRKVQDGNPLAELFATPIPHERNAREVSDWLEQARAQEQRVAASLELLETEGRFNQTFPMYRHSCFNYQRTCEFAPLCHEGMQPDSGLYQVRRDHHAAVIESS